MYNIEDESMSLVEAQDGRYYSAPFWSGTYGEDLQWFLNRTYDLELKVEVLSKHDKNVKKHIINTLQNNKFGDFKISKAEYWDAQPFPPNWRRAKSFNYIFTPLSPLPVPKEYDAAFDTPDYDDLRYCWTVPFRTEDVWLFFQKYNASWATPKTIGAKKLNKILGGFVLGKIYIDTSSMQIAVKNKLKRQYDFTKTDLESVLTKHGPYIKVARP